MIGKMKSFFKKEIVFCISAAVAVITMFFVAPSAEYIQYIDFRVLCLLFCLMAVVAGFKSVGSFGWLTCQLLSRIKSGRILCIALVMLPFFSSMLVTNDVALLIFIPFTMSLLLELEQEKAIVPVIVLQTVAANLGSMATPVGNPQNLFLYSKYSLGIADFFSAVLPLTALSLILLVVFSLRVLPKELQSHKQQIEKISDKKKLAVYALLFIVCLLTVFRVVPYVVTTALIIAVLLFIDRKLFKEIDFMLLATFICFFIISENLGRIDGVRVFLQNLLNKNTLLTAVGASQVISNVPAAVLLSGFTDDWKSLVMGTNIGGLGTPVASLASLITLKLYLKAPNGKFAKFMLVFTAVNVVLLAALLVFTFVI